MVLSFAAYRQSLDDSLVVGDAVTADLHRYPGPSSRALVGTVHDDGVGGRRARPAGGHRRRGLRRASARSSPPSRGSIACRRRCSPRPTLGRRSLGAHRRHRRLALVPDAPGLADAARRVRRAGRSPSPWSGRSTAPSRSPSTSPTGRSTSAPCRPVVRERGVTRPMTIADHWHELVTVSLLGTDRRDPPEPPPGPLADVVADAAAPRRRRSGCSPPSAPASPPAGPASCRCRRPPALAPPAADDRPMVPPAAARRWRTIVAEWPVLEDEWLHEVERRGWRLSPDVLVGLLRRHRTDAARRARVVRVGGPVVAWLCEHQPDLRPPSPRRAAARSTTGLPALAVPPTLLALLDGAGRRRSSPPSLGGFVDGTFGRTHRAVLVNFVARTRPDGLRGAGRRARPATTSRSTARRPGPLAGRPGHDPPPDAARSCDAMSRAGRRRPAPPRRDPVRRRAGRRSPPSTTGRAHRTGGCRRGPSSPTCSAACCPTARRSRRSTSASAGWSRSPWPRWPPTGPCSCSACRARPRRGSASTSRRPSAATRRCSSRAPPARPRSRCATAGTTPGCWPRARARCVDMLERARVVTMRTARRSGRSST